MAALLTLSLPQSRSSILTAVRAIELVLLSAGLIYTILMFKGALVSTSSYDFMHSTLRKPVSIFRSWLSSPLHICIFMNFIVILIAVSSRFHRPQLENSSDVEDGGGDIHKDYDLHSALSPSLAAPPPMQNNQKKHLQERKPKDIAVAAPETTATVATATTKTSTVGKITTATTSLKNQQDTKVTNGVKRVYECHQQSVLTDFSRLTKAKEIKKEQATIDGGKIRTTEQDTRDINVTEVIERYSVQAMFADLPKLREAKEIKTGHSVDSSKQVKTIQNPMKETTTKHGQVNRNEKQSQTEKQLENEDWDEEDTMEATWRAINGGTKPQEKQLKKSETWPQPQKFVLAEESEENMALPMPSSGGAVLVKELRKSMTFDDTVTIRCRGGLRRDPSMNLEEFNQRVEAFIKNFNHEMRLQRQESDQRYLDMIRQGL